MRRLSKRTLGVTILLLVALYVGIEYLSLPDVAFLKKKLPEETALMEQRDHEYEVRHHGKAPEHFQVVVSYNALPDSLKTAVLIGEDDAFFQHEGFDYQRIKEALTVDWEKKRFARGASTITQQLAKNLFLSTSKNPIRKLKEAILASRLEKELGKRRIFEIYLNVIEWGENVYGAEAASRYYFGKSASQLSLNEAVLLAAIIPSPVRMNPFASLKRSQFRRGIILDRMYRYHHISEEEYHAASSDSLVLRSNPHAPAPAPED
ncbi:MAG: monofunctional biosynthetic peptidoglycan transglycosylase [Terriglobia bacterium]